MNELTKIQSMIFIAGAIMMVLGIGGVLFGIVTEVSAVVYALGTVLFAVMQMLQTYEGSSITIRRLRKIMTIGDVCFILSGLFVVENVFHIIYPLMTTSIERYNFYIHYIYNNWVVFLLIAAILEVYTIHRIDSELKKEND